VPLLGKVPLTMPLREQADAGVPLTIADADDAAAVAVHQAARGLIAMAPPPALPLLAVNQVGGELPQEERATAGTTLPMAG
jgi:ATP-binding protein involved in chromosome partitioning